MKCIEEAGNDCKNCPWFSDCPILKIGKAKEIFILQPCTAMCKKHWLKTTIRAIDYSDDEIVFSTKDTVFLSESNSCNEFFLSDEGDTWAYNKPK
jgi:hypothetical protein